MSPKSSKCKFFLRYKKVLFQSKEHEEIIRAAVEEYKPVPDDILAAYADREWAKQEMERREVMKSYAWLVDMAAGMESPEEFKNFFEAMGTDEERAAARDMGEKNEDRFYKEIWSRANLRT